MPAPNTDEGAGGQSAISLFNLQDGANGVEPPPVAPATRRDYSNICSKMAEWFLEQNFNTAARYNDQEGAHELIVQGITADMISQYLLFQVRDGKSFSTLSSMRSAIKYAFAEKRLKMPEEITQKISLLIRGCKEKYTREVRLGTSKDPIKYNLYRTVQKILVKESQPNIALCSALTWNLMCKSSITTSIDLDRIGWENDSLTIWFPICDQAGNQTVIPKHVFANPFEPEVCPILHLGVYLLLHPELTGKLFPGNNPHHTFAQALSKLLPKERHAQVLAMHSVSPDDYRLSGYPAGASTYVAGASTISPSYTALCNRAGWKHGAFQGPSIQYESAQDQLIGRLVCGLPVDSEKFAILPPHFDVEAVENNGINVLKVIESCFPRLSRSVPHFFPILQHCIASVVYHRKWLQHNLPRTHKLFFTPLFTTRGLLHKLKQHIIVSHTSTYMSATGIPPHVPMLLKIAESQKRDDVLVSRIEQLLNDQSGRTSGNLQLHRNYILSIVKEAMKPLTEKLPASQDATPSVREQSVITSRQTSQAEVQSARQRSRARMHGGLALRDDGDAAAPFLHQHVYPDGNAYLVPPDYRLPACNVALGWRLWWFGDENRRVSPFRKLEGGCPPNSTSLQKRLNDWKHVYGKMEQYLRLTNQIRGGSYPSDLDVSEMYESVSEQLITGMCPSKTKKRKNELSVLTFAKRFRKFNPEDAAQSWNASQSTTSTNRASASQQDQV